MGLLRRILANGIFFARNFFGIRSGCVQKSIIFAALLKNLKKV
jgi:hypothetical protein